MNTQRLQDEATATDASEKRLIRITPMQDQSPIAITTIAFTWDMHDSGTDDPRGLTLVRGREIPASVRMRPECKAVIETLLGLEEVAFVILPPRHSSNMLHVGRLSLADEKTIMLRVAAALSDFNIEVVNPAP